MKNQEPDSVPKRVDTARLKKKILGALGKIPFSEEAAAAHFCARDPATPKHVKTAILAALTYFIVPTDAIPDFVAVLGFTDDATVFWAVWRLVAGHVNDDHRRRARALLGTTRD